MPQVSAPKAHRSRGGVQINSAVGAGVAAALFLGAFLAAKFRRRRKASGSTANAADYHDLIKPCARPLRLSDATSGALPLQGVTLVVSPLYAPVNQPLHVLRSNIEHK